MRFHELAAEMRAAASTYEPEDMPAYLRDLERMPDALREIAAAFRIMRERAADTLPVHTAVVDMLGAVGHAQMATAEAAADLPPAFRNLHRHELSRHEEPRPGESKWNV